MSRGSGSELVIHFDRVHIISVNHFRKEARLFENGGSKEGTLIFKSDEPAARASVTDAMQLMDMALRFGVSYDLLSRVVSEPIQKVFDLLGVKAFLDKVIALTTEEERHQRFEGFKFSFAHTPTEDAPSQTQPEAAALPTDEAADPAGKKKATK